MMSVSLFECWLIIADNFIRSYPPVWRLGIWLPAHYSKIFFTTNIYCGLRIGQICWNYWSFRGMQTSNVYL